MTWVDNNGELRPQSWEEYLSMKDGALTKDWREQRQIDRVPSRPLKKTKRENIPRMRIRLFRADPHCFWCGVEVELNLPHQHSRLATVDHLYSRFHPERLLKHQSQPNAGPNVLHVLACGSCNNKRSRCETRQEPFIPKLAERLEYAQRADATLARISNPTPESKLATKKKDKREGPILPRADLATYDQMIINAPDWPTTKLLMEARHRYLNQRREIRVICTLKEAIEFARENPSR